MQLQKQHEAHAGSKEGEGSGLFDIISRTLIAKQCRRRGRRAVDDNFDRGQYLDEHVSKTERDRSQMAP